MTDPAAFSARAVQRRLREIECAARTHPWDEHVYPGGWAHDHCGECQYELEHGEAPPGQTLCRRVVPDELLSRPTAQELERAAPLRRKVILRLAGLLNAFVGLWS
ncbi:hypothetical protein GCM10025780_07940 [Frondihabitans cladoniiphilus]|uniref:Uncharacterized protein n=1 Tax=Frondihabitans cladoniiphilus TaxID=715785 RepID=A0ABP8VMP4_9MICO